MTGWSQAVRSHRTKAVLIGGRTLPSPVGGDGRGLRELSRTCYLVCLSATEEAP